MGASTPLSDFAHRGLWNERVAENSMSAFSLAIRHGYGIELDLRLTKDGQVVVFHDETLLRMCGREAKVSELSLAELRRLRLKGTADTVPTLAEVLALVRGRVPLLIEIKGERPDPQLLLPACELLDAYEGAFCVQSFSPLILSWFKSYRPGFSRGLLLNRLTEKELPGSPLIRFLLSHMLLNVLARPDFLSVRGDLRRYPSVLLCHKLLRKPCFAWTIRKSSDYRLCRKDGFYVIFERIQPPRSVGRSRMSP
jgi:glycerophosphoryl diester phosphodiesterase